jgi:hypothetical protein
VANPICPRFRCSSNASRSGDAIGEHTDCGCCWVSPVESSPFDSGPVEFSPVEFGPVEFGPVESGPGSSIRGGLHLSEGRGLNGICYPGTSDALRFTFDLNFGCNSCCDFSWNFSCKLGSSSASNITRIAFGGAAPSSIRSGFGSEHLPLREFNSLCAARRPGSHELSGLLGSGCSSVV